MAEKHFSTECLCLQTRRTDRILTQLYDSFIKKSGLKSTQYSFLRCINKLEEPCVSDISRALAMDQTTVSRNINVLRQKGLVVAQPSHRDPRRTLIIITPLGREMMESGKIAWQNAQNTVKAKIGEKNFTELCELLDKISRILE